MSMKGVRKGGDFALGDRRWHLCSSWDRQEEVFSDGGRIDGLLDSLGGYYYHFNYITTQIMNL